MLKDGVDLNKTGINNKSVLSFSKRQLIGGKNTTNIKFEHTQDEFLDVQNLHSDANKVSIS